MSARSKTWRGIRLFTIGHSTRTLDELVAMLRAFDVHVLADIRTIPRSRHNPQFDRAALRASLRARGFRYVHVPELGGLRHARADSTNTGWRNASFRGYADYMQTAEFEAGLAKLRALVTEGTVAVMCAEAVPWRCHRSLLSDALTARGARVEHITGMRHARAHRLTAFAKVEGARVTYPGVVTGRLATRGPFHPEATVRVLQRRPTNLVDVWEDGHYLRVLDTVDGLALVAVANRGTIARPDVWYEVLEGTVSARTSGDVEQTLGSVLGLGIDPRPLQRLAEAEARLATTAIALRGMRPPRFAGLFEAFANVVPFQQVSLDAGAAIVRRIVERFGKSIEHAGARRYAFPAAATIAHARTASLAACGLSRRKAETLRRIAAQIESGELAADKLAGMPSADAIAYLTQLDGIGPWSAGLVLLRGLGRLDVFPSGDVGVARGLGALLHVQSFARVLARFGDRRGYLYFCSLGNALLARGLIHPAS